MNSASLFLFVWSSLLSCCSCWLLFLIVRLAVLSYLLRSFHFIWRVPNTTSAMLFAWPITQCSGVHVDVLLFFTRYIFVLRVCPVGYFSPAGFFLVPFVIFSLFCPRVRSHFQFCSSVSSFSLAPPHVMGSKTSQLGGLGWLWCARSLVCLGPSH